ncbi:MAG TPA: hypothetical protein VNX47_00060 [Nevskia sp.]|nr:hypothetical protein [Nevskia sp.]
MALTIPCDTSRVVDLDEFIDHVHSHVDLRDQDSIAAAAPMFRALANDRELVVRRINQQVKTRFRSQAVASAQVIYLGEGRDFYLRANVWPSNADIASGRVYQDQFSYHQAHDHNYNFMTVGYHGPGYLTEIHEYDHEKLEGFPGEKVDFRFLERTLFGPGMVMLYRASKDVHIQYPPDDLSVTLNFMIATPEVRTRDQYFFDLESRTLLDYPAELDGSRRVSVLKMAAHVGNGDTRQLLEDLARSHPCRRTRLAAWQAQAQMSPREAAPIWEAAARDREPLVSQVAAERLLALAG